MNPLSADLEVCVCHELSHKVLTLYHDKAAAEYEFGSVCSCLRNQMLKRLTPSFGHHAPNGSLYPSMFCCQWVCSPQQPGVHKAQL